jgi:hypothetical protein
VLDKTGSVLISFPEGAGTLDRLPAVSCYVADRPDGAYMQISTDPTLHYQCVVVDNGKGSIGVLLSVGADGDSYANGWSYQIVVRPQNAS